MLGHSLSNVVGFSMVLPFGFKFGSKIWIKSTFVLQLGMMQHKFDDFSRMSVRLSEKSCYAISNGLKLIHSIRLPNCRYSLLIDDYSVYYTRVCANYFHISL